MVNDGSKDKSGEIIDEYANKYEECIAIHLKTNTGYAGGPRNIGLEHATGDYIMFLDPDDEYVEDACEVLYNTITEYNADVAFARFRRIFKDYTQKSYSPYKDKLNKYYPNEDLKDANHLNVPDFLWNNFFEKFLYGKNLKGKYERDKPIDMIHINNINEEVDLLKMRPSIWTKIIKRELITENNIKFPPYITGEDMAFNLEVLLYAKGIVFLNNYLSYNYQVRDGSVTNSVNSKFLNDLMDSLIYARKITDSFPKEIQNSIVNPHLLYWINTWKNNKFTDEENQVFLEKINELESIHNKDMKTKFIMKTIKTMVK